MKCVLRAWGELESRFGFWHWVKCVSGHGGQLERGLEVLALGEMCFEGVGAVEKGV